MVICFTAEAQVTPGDVDGDGDVDRNDIVLIVAALNTPASVDDPRDINGDGFITILDVRQASQLCTRPGCAVEAVQLDIDQAPAKLVLAPGAAANVSTSVIYDTTDSQGRTIVITQEISPNDGGISISPAITPQFNVSSDFTQLDNQTIQALAPGEYEIVTTAEIASESLRVTSTIDVIVTEDTSPLTLNIPGTEPSALAPGGTTNVLFTVQASGGGPENPPTVTVLGVGNPSFGVLNDDGTNGDLSPGDLSYAGVVTVSTVGLVGGDCLQFRASGGGVLSDIHELCVSTLPLGISPSDLSNPFSSNEGGQPVDVIRNEILAIFAAGTTEAQINAAAAVVDAAVVGTIPEIRLVQLRLNEIPGSLGELEALVASLADLPQVESATVNAIGQTTAVTTNDPRLGGQGSLTTIRADEAWTIARGGPAIAVLDTGVDHTHPDLSGKVILGPDIINGDANPFDDHGHGTHVAGIAAARTNNGVGIAGVAWNSSILAVKVLNADGNGSATAVASGIIHAANRGARVINLSLRSYSTSWALITCPAVAYARFIKGSVVVVAAGNEGTSSVPWPSGCAGAFTIGSTTLADARSGFSNFGGYVNLAAPGSGILSTLPTGGCKLCDPSGYGVLDGTSMATPHVAGAIAVLLSRQPGLSAAQIEERLGRTARILPAALQLGAGRLDLFEAVFNGSFEEQDMALWDVVGTVASIPALGPLTPRHRRRMALISTGPAGDQVSGTMSQTFTLQPGVSSLPISFEYAFISEEYPEFVGTQFNDSLEITLMAPGGGTTTLATESINASAFSLIGGINFPGGDDTVGWTGWKTVSVTLPVSPGGGQYRVFLTDAGDDIYDTVTLIDNIRFR